VIGDDNDVIVCISEEDVYESAGDETSIDNGGTSSSWVLDSISTFHIYLWRDWFDSFREVSGEAVILVEGLTLSIIRVGTIRFRMWDDMQFLVLSLYGLLQNSFHLLNGKLFIKFCYFYINDVYLFLGF
jgi:hypothetical protein